MLPSTPGGVLLQGGDARREPPIVLAQRAGTPYESRYEVVGSVAHPLEPAVCTGRLVAFQEGCASAGARSCWSPPRRGFVVPSAARVKAMVQYPALSPWCTKTRCESMSFGYRSNRNSEVSVLRPTKVVHEDADASR